MKRAWAARIIVSLMIFGVCSAAAWLFNRDPVAGGGVDWQACAAACASGFVIGALLGMKWWPQIAVIALSQICVFTGLYGLDPLAPIGIVLGGLVVAAGWLAGIAVRRGIERLWAIKCEMKGG